MRKGNLSTYWDLPHCAQPDEIVFTSLLVYYFLHKQGRVLILDGIERAERNVLPTLNNLLEGREMSLPDGRFLVAHSRQVLLVA